MRPSQGREQSSILCTRTKNSMKTNTINHIKAILSDRLLTVLIILLLLVAMAYCVFVGISLRPSDLQVAVHYTAFGDASFYRDKWYYFTNFIALGALIGASHAVLTVKLYAQGRRQIAILFVLLSLLVLIIAWILTWAVLRVAFL